ncbi:hypothetical protein LXL04_003492 [Taraxacum kok-saghyz]
MGIDGIGREGFLRVKAIDAGASTTNAFTTFHSYLPSGLNKYFSYPLSLPNTQSFCNRFYTKHHFASVDLHTKLRFPSGKHRASAIVSNLRCPPLLFKLIKQ